MNCPSCGTKIDADFGMISCPMCSNVFMVEMDGSIQELKAESEIYSEDPSLEFGAEPVAESADNYTANEDISSEELPSLDGSADFSTASEEPFSDEYAEPDAEVMADGVSSYGEPIADETTRLVSENSEIEGAEEESIYNEDFIDDFNNPKSRGSDGTDPLGVVAFDESTASSALEGLYYYDLKISGLDSAQIRENVIDALTDPRFDWVGDEIKKKISGGELILNNLNPVKAVLAVIRLQPLDVEVNWEQKLFTDESVQEQDGEA